MKTIVVEFVGLPGCGKSTVADIVRSRLNELGYKVGSDKNIYDNNIIVSGIKLLISFINPGNHRFNSQLRKTLTVVIDHKNFLYTLKRYFKIVKLNGNINRERKKYDYLILSEGYLQVYSSIFDNAKMKNESIHNYWINIDKNMWRCFTIDINEKIASKRILLRGERNDEWYFMDMNTRKKNLHRRSANINRIVDNIDTSILDGNKSPDIISEEVITILEEL